ncbi:hypothetical protein EDB87DRAFT_1418325 [Lactarius vividus]|nr:hypothetical protein EDB87DRAFT_1418325 [Lactarius vividus]
MICAKAVDPAHDLMLAHEAVDIILFNDQDGGPLAAEILPIVRGWRDNTDEGTKMVTQTTQATTSSVVARARRRDDPWFILTSNELSVPESVLREYAAHGDSLSLAILLHITRQQFNRFSEDYWPSYGFSRVLEVASEFNVQDTSPELQHEFCALWDQIVLHVQNHNDGMMAFYILGRIRNVYTALHQDADSAPTRFSDSTPSDDPILDQPSSYPVCNVAGHIHGIVPHDNATLPPASLASPDAHFSSVPTAPHVVESPTEVSPLDGFLPIHQTPIEGLRIITTSQDPATTGAIRDVVTSTSTVPHYTPDISISAPPLSSPPTTFSLQHNTDLPTPSDPLNLPFSASSNQVLGNILPPEPHRSIIVTAPSTSPGLTSAPGLSITAGDDDSRRHEDVGPPSVNRATHTNDTTTPSMVSEADPDTSAIAGPSQPAECAGDHSPHPSH